MAWRLVWFCAALAVTRAALAAPPLAIDPLVEAAMKEWRVPGLAMAVVKEGRVIHSRTYGHRDVEKKLAVTPKTLFGIGSITKSFTVLLLSTLAEEGKFDWDRPVREYAPDFRLQDPVAASLTTGVDLVSHRTGLPRHDTMWFTGFTRNEIFGRLRHLEPSRDFRSTFQYNNLMYLAAGVVAERVAGGGRTWEELVRTRLFEPLGMTDATFSVTAAERTRDWSLNYALEKDELKPIPATTSVEAVCPAGCINATLEEMTRYLQAHLAKGKAPGATQAFLPATHFERMREPRIFVPAGAFGSERLGPGAYGMGLAVMTYRGHKVVFHTGTIGGYHALLAFLPDDQVGAVILQNRVARAVPQLLSWTLWDQLLGLEPSGWLEKFREDEKTAKAKAEEARQAVEKTRRSGTAPAHMLADYAGVYRHPGYGDAEIAVREGALELRFGGRTRRLEHFHFDVFRYEADPPQRVRFLTNVDGAVDQLAVRLEPAVAEVLFTRTRR